MLVLVISVLVNKIKIIVYNQRKHHGLKLRFTLAPPVRQPNLQPILHLFFTWYNHTRKSMALN